MIGSSGNSGFRGSEHPPQLPPLVRGQQLRSGPYTVTVTDDMVAQRERENQQLYRTWYLEQQRMANHYGDPNERFGPEFRDDKVRRTFIRKVFFILSIQLGFTAGVIAMFMLWDKTHEFLLHTPYIPFAAGIIFMFSFCLIICVESARRSFPCNVICLIVLTMSLSVLVACLSVFYEIDAVLIAIGATVGITLIVAFVATCASFDMTKHIGWFCVIIIILIISSMMLVICSIFTHIETFQLIYGVLGATIMSLYLFFDIQVIMGGRRIEMSPDEVILATTQLYVDIIFLYQYMLRIGDYASRN